VPWFRLAQSLVLAAILGKTQDANLLTEQLAPAYEGYVFVSPRGCARTRLLLTVSITFTHAGKVTAKTDSAVSSGPQACCRISPTNGRDGIQEAAHRKRTQRKRGARYRSASPESGQYRNMEKQDRRGLRMVVVEDLQNVRVLLHDLVGILGGLTIVHETSTEAEAKLWMEENAPDWDVAIIDLVLESGSGMGVVAHARKVHAAAKIAVFSGYASAGVRGHCFRVGADQVFDKAETEAFVRWLHSLRHDQLAERGSDAPPRH
jgi:two-component system, OmpR family, response regulator